MCEFTHIHIFPFTSQKNGKGIVIEKLIEDYLIWNNQHFINSSNKFKKFKTINPLHIVKYEKWFLIAQLQIMTNSPNQTTR